MGRLGSGASLAHWQPTPFFQHRDGVLAPVASGWRKDTNAALEEEARQQVAAAAAERCAQQGKGEQETQAIVEKALAKAVPPPRMTRKSTFSSPLVGRARRGGGAGTSWTHP